MAAKYQVLLGGLLLLLLAISGYQQLDRSSAPQSQSVPPDSAAESARAAVGHDGAKSAKPLKIGAVSQFLPPYNCDESFQQYCIIPEVMKRVVTPRGYQAEFVSVSQPRQYIELGTGRLDAAMVYLNPSLTRKDYPETLHICPVAAFRAPISAFARRDRDIAINSVEDMARQRLVAIRLPPFQRGMLGPKEFPHITRANSVRAIMKTIASGRADFGLYEYYVALYVINQLKLNQELHWVRDITYIDYHLALSKLSLEKDPALASLCDDVRALRRSGEIQQIVNHGRQVLVGHLEPAMRRTLTRQRDSQPPLL